MTPNFIGVVEALTRRKRAGGHGPFTDDCKIALVAEGGAMRGVIAGGMVSAIEDCGLAGCFDLMIGSSAGACSLAYLRAGQARYGTRIFSEDINNKNFIDKARLLRGKAIVDIDFVVDQVFAKSKPLNLDALGHAGPDLYATATDADRAVTSLLTGFNQPGRAYEILRATSRMPLLAAGPVLIDGRRYLDGGTLMHIPIQAALDLSATHILVILTNSAAKFARPRPSVEDRMILPTLIRMVYGSALARAVRAEADHNLKMQKGLVSGQSSIIGGAQVTAVRPSPGMPPIARDEMSSQNLIAAARDAERNMHSVLTSR